jgi:hypothetical protein
MADNELQVSDELKQVCEKIDIKYLSGIKFDDIGFLVSDNFIGVGSNFKNGKYSTAPIDINIVDKYLSIHG